MIPRKEYLWDRRGGRVHERMSQGPLADEKEEEGSMKGVETTEVDGIGRKSP